MRLIGQERLLELLGFDPDIDVWISAWVREITTNHWLGPVGLIDAYPRVIKCEAGVYVFPVLDSLHRIEVVFGFNEGIALVRAVFINK